MWTRLLDTGGQYRNFLPDVGVLPSRFGPRSALERSRAQHHLASSSGCSFRKGSSLPQGRRIAMGMMLLDSFNSLELGHELHEFAARLYPIARSITGNGIRETLALIGQRIPLQIVEVPTGTTVFDWTVPKEWNIHDAYIKDPLGNRVVDFQRCNLHVMSYSTPV